ncbi:MAG: DUF2723 domain-containing protein [Verrucomicrobia bacterium]|nr:MAG: DUF2723 domain-containing protein [Verrucomicrobiota bacterium]
MAKLISPAAQPAAVRPAQKPSPGVAVPNANFPAAGPLFRGVDWLVFALVTLVVFVAYYYTIAPDLTLEDSGELAVGSMYAGVPHPPGYPVWTIYTWLFTKLLPFSNIAWRVAVSSAVAAAISAGVTGMLASRGAALVLEGLADLKEAFDGWCNPICLVSGFVAGLMIGFNGYIWSQAVIVEVYTIAVLTLVGVLAALMRWTWNPHQRRWLYLACFLFGLCFCNHQTLIVAALGLEIVVLMADRQVGRDMMFMNTLIWWGMLGLHVGGKIQTFQANPALLFIFNLIGFISAGLCAWATFTTGRLFTRLHVLAAAVVCFLVGFSFYLYMPVASSTNPPMNWGYPRTWEGFVHAFTRGQYEKTTPGISFRQIWAYFEGLKEEFNWANLIFALVPFAFLKRMRPRERGWIVGLTSIYVCLAFLLLYLLNSGVDRQSRELTKVFYTSSHVVVAIVIGFGIAVVAGLVLAQNVERRLWLLGGGALAAALNLRQVFEVFDPSVNVFYIPRVAALISLTLSAAFLVILLFDNALQIATGKRGAALGALLAVFSLIPVDSVLDHWADNEQRGHYFGFWFGHDMFEPGFDTAVAKAPRDKAGKPLYPSMDQHTVLFGGTDPGRFCPTYMIFCESFIPPQDRRDPKFDRRDVYIITQNALADNTYLDYIRAHYNNSAQHDLPFFQSMLNDKVSIARGRTNALAGLFGPVDQRVTGLGSRMEKQRRVGASFFAPSHLKDAAALARRIDTAADPVSAHLKSLLRGPLPPDAAALATALNAVIDGPSIHATNRFAGVKLSDHVARFAAQDPKGHTRVRLNRLLLEEAYPGLIAPSEGGLFPDMEIDIPSPEDLGRCFEEYTADAQRRYGQKQLRAGENLVQLPDGRVSVSGQTAVMAINGLLTKVIFDRNPGHAFYVEESFALDWMYPHLVPYGIILKIERQPVAQLGDEQIARDHEFWSKYSERFIGNWITYETPVKEVCDFVLKTYKRRDLSGFKGDPRFVRDDNAQKAFSKLRNAIGKSVYAWRAQETHDPAYQAKLLKESEFALKQAFAFCPYSPETVFNYASVLAGLGHYADAYKVVETCYEFDHDNAGILDLLNQLARYKDMSLPPAQVLTAATNAAARAEILSGVTNLESAFLVASALFQQGRSNEGVEVLDSQLTRPDSDSRTVLSLIQAYQQLGRADRMEQALERYTRLAPTSPEAWYNLAAIQALQSKPASAVTTLAKALALSDARLATNPAAANVRTQFVADPRFDTIRASLPK